MDINKVSCGVCGLSVPAPPNGLFIIHQTNLFPATVCVALPDLQHRFSAPTRGQGTVKLTPPRQGFNCEDVTKEVNDKALAQSFF